MIYVDTSVLVALHLPEAKSHDVDQWYASCKETLVSATWCVSEFASALSIKQRTGQIDASAALKAWQQFERMCASDLQLLPVEHATFHHAAIFALDVKSGLRSGDALHLASAISAKVKSMATLDVLLAKNASQQKLNVINI